MRLVRGAILACLCLWPSMALAHQDMFFRIADDGELVGFPAEYGPAYIRLRFGAPDAASQTLESAVVVLGKQSVALPTCIRKLFSVPQGEQISAHGSWYHDLKLLPPYLTFNLPQNSETPEYFNGHSVTFDMQTARLLEVRKHILIDDRGSTMPLVSLGELCTTAEIESLRPVVRDK